VADLLAKGLDGYFVDPEGKPGKPYDWDRIALDDLAAEFCTRITMAAPGKPFGIASHYRVLDIFPHLPWRTFFKYSSVLLPQAYWRSDEGKIGHGPVANYQMALDKWVAAGGQRAKMVPMAGELSHAIAQEVDLYADAATAHGIDQLHFYTYEERVTAPVWDAITRS
jgi:hypothetical protein